jgi:hypothetical protein
MKRYAAAFATIVLTCAVAPIALAQDNSFAASAVVEDGNATIVSEPGTQNLPLDQLSAFDQVAESHPDMAKALARKPALIGSDKFVAKYPELQEFLSRYPDARENIRENPGNYLTPVSGSTWSQVAPGVKDGVMDGTAKDAEKDGGMMNGRGTRKDSGVINDGGIMHDVVKDPR